MLSVSRLRLLVELHRRGTLAQVAEALSYTPSAVSQQLSLLEREAGVPLLERVGRGVRLTGAAVTLVAHAEAVLTQLELAESDLAAVQSTVGGALRVASFQTVVFAIIPQVLDLLAARHPDLHVDFSQLQVDEAYDGLHSQRFDVILGEEYPGLPEPIRPGIDRSDLVNDPLRIALPLSGRWAARPVTLAELADAPWAMDPAHSATGTWARGVCRTAGFEPWVRFESPDPLMHSHLVRGGHAVAFIPALIVAAVAGVAFGGLPGDPERILYTAVRTGRAGHPAVGAFRSALAEATTTLATSQPSWAISGSARRSGRV